MQLTEDYNSFGPGFNSIGGGWCVTANYLLTNLAAYRIICRYAMERTNDYIKVWFWERGNIFAPFDATHGAWIIDTSLWVTVLAPLLDWMLTYGLTVRELLPLISLTPTVTSSLTLMPTTLSST